MNQRMLGNTGVSVSEIGLGTWQLGGRWGEDYDQKKAESILQTAEKHQINFFDTADVYNGGESEKSIGKIIKKQERYFCGDQSRQTIKPTYSRNVHRDCHERIC